MTHNETSTNPDVDNDSLPEYSAEADILKDPIWQPAIFNRVEGVNTESGRLVHGFVPTRYELGVIIKAYYDRACASDVDGLLLGIVSSHEQRFTAFAGSRLRTLAELVGKSTFDSLTDPIYKKWCDCIEAHRASPKLPDGYPVHPAPSTAEAAKRLGVEPEELLQLVEAGCIPRPQSREELNWTVQDLERAYAALATDPPFDDEPVDDEPQDA